MQLYHIPSDYFERHWKQSDWVRLLAAMQEKPKERKGVKLSAFLGI
jgi:hypothetical protein